MSSACSIKPFRTLCAIVAIAVFCLILLADSADAAQRRRTHHAQAPHASRPAPAPVGYCDIQSRCASILIDGSTGNILRGENFDRQVYPASITKLMTLYLMFEAIENGRFELTDRITVSAHAAAADPTKIGLEPGSTITIEDAIEAVAVKSANDMAIAISEAVGGSEDAFARRMNQKAQQLGMTRTHFENASGLPNTEQLTTARDMSRLAQRILRDFPGYKHYLGLRSAQVAGRQIQGHNRLLTSGDCTGGKTGYIRASGFNLVAWNEKGGRQVIAAVFGGRSISARDQKVAELLRSGMGVIPAAPTQELAVASLNATTTWIPPTMPQPRPGSTPQLNDKPSDNLPAARTNTSEETENVNATDEAAMPAALASAENSGLERAGLVPSAPQNTAPTTLVSVPPDSFKIPTNTFASSWAIQVGAYRDAGQAQRALSQATRSLPTLLGTAFPRALPTTTNMGQLFRAQIIGLDETSAKAACTSLAQLGMQCLPMPPGQSS